MAVRRLVDRAPEVTDRLVDAITGGTFDLIIVNFANGDMVGHTGVLDAAVKAAETIDASLARLEKAIKSAGGVMLDSNNSFICQYISKFNSISMVLIMIIGLFRDDGLCAQLRRNALFHR